MCKLTERETQILDKLLVAETAIVARDLKISESTIYVVKARVRGKEEMCRDYLRKIRKYKSVLHR